MSKHTPGPWTLETVATQVGHCHKIMPIEACLYVHNQRLPHDAANLPSRVGLANANLIAAAPDLLKACRMMVELWDAEHADSPCACDAQAPDDITAPGPCEMCFARNAIAKAEGTSND